MIKIFQNTAHFLTILITTENLNLTADLKHFLDISFDETLKIIDYTYSNKGRINLSCN